MPLGGRCSRYRGRAPAAVTEEAQPGDRPEPLAVAGEVVLPPLLKCERGRSVESGANRAFSPRAQPASAAERERSGDRTIVPVGAGSCRGRSPLRGEPPPARAAGPAAPGAGAELSGEGLLS